MQAAGQCCTLVSAQGAAEPAACSGPGPGGQQPLLGIVSPGRRPPGWSRADVLGHTATCTAASDEAPPGLQHRTLNPKP